MLLILGTINSHWRKLSTEHSLIAFLVTYNMLSPHQSLQLCYEISTSRFLTLQMRKHILMPYLVVTSLSSTSMIWTHLSLPSLKCFCSLHYSFRSMYIFQRWWINLYQVFKLDWRLTCHPSWRIFTYLTEGFADTTYIQLFITWPIYTTDTRDLCSLGTYRFVDHMDINQIIHRSI